jgi:hypothetical protein
MVTERPFYLEKPYCYMPIEGVKPSSSNDAVVRALSGAFAQRFYASNYVGQLDGISDSCNIEH